eukprot:g7667.t1
MYKTDAHQQMLEGVLQRPKRFGAGLPPPEDTKIDYNRVINYDKQQGDSRWAAITATEFVAPGDGSEKSKEFASSFKLTGGLTDPDELREYRNNWTVEKDCVRPVRFRTDAVTSSNTGVPACFRTTETRKLPGVPKAAERLRKKVLESGPMGVIRLRQALQQRVQADESAGTGDGSCRRLVRANDLIDGVRDAGLTTLSALDSKKVIECFGTRENAHGGSGVGAKVDDIFEGLGLSLGGVTMGEKRSRAVSDAFRELDEDGSGVLRAGNLRRRYAAAAAASVNDGRGAMTRTDAGAGSGCPAEVARQTLLDSLSLYQDTGEDGMTSAGFEGFMASASRGAQSDADFDAVLLALVGK